MKQLETEGANRTFRFLSLLQFCKKCRNVRNPSETHDDDGDDSIPHPHSTHVSQRPPKSSSTRHGGHLYGEYEQSVGIYPMEMAISSDGEQQ